MKKFIGLLLIAGTMAFSVGCQKGSGKQWVKKKDKTGY